MKISFVVVAYNEAENIADCINSIESLEGLPREHETVIVNDGSTDATAEIVRSCAKQYGAVKLLNQENKGRGGARASGISEITGDLVAMIDGDIILPSDWLIVCEKYLDAYDAVSATPVPDGDAAFTFKKFRLRPKTVVSSTPIAGSNGLYKGELFSKVKFDPNLKVGVDTDFCHRLEAQGFKLHRLVDYTVLHNESRSYLSSIKWLYQYGVGATRQLRTYKQVRLPDLAYFVFISLVLIAIVCVVFFRWWPLLLVALLYPLITSFLFIKKKFYYEFPQTLEFLEAVAANYVLMVGYFTGRSIGWLKGKI